MNCEFPACNRSTVGDKKMCFMHNLKYGTKAPKPQPAPIAKKSEKMKLEDKEYKKIVKEMLTENDRCELSTPVCIIKAQGLHHMKKRGANLLNKDYLKRACNPCNYWVELHPKLAMEMGIVLSKFN